MADETNPLEGGCPRCAQREDQAASIRTLIDAGYSPDSAVAYVQTLDLGELRHSGPYSIQLQPPDDDEDPPPDGAPAEVT